MLVMALTPTGKPGKWENFFKSRNFEHIGKNLHKILEKAIFVFFL